MNPAALIADDRESGLVASQSTEKARKVLPEELTQGFRRVGLQEGRALMLHASLHTLGSVEGGAAMVLHRLLGVIGKQGTLMMPTFTYVTTHGNYHENEKGDYTKPGCWCEGNENRHIPFISELQPDKRIGEIAHRLCSWPASRRSRHPSYSFVAVGRNSDECVREHPFMDPLLPVKKILRFDPYVLLIGVDLDCATAIHLAEERKTRWKMEKLRALTVTGEGQTWVEVLGIGCSKGFAKIRSYLPEHAQASIGSAHVELHSMKSLVDWAESLLSKDPMALACDDLACLGCRLAARPP